MREREREVEVEREREREMSCGERGREREDANNWGREQRTCNNDRLETGFGQKLGFIFCPEMGSAAQLTEILIRRNKLKKAATESCDGWVPVSFIPPLPSSS